jgi:hypothetical protein
LFAAVAYSQPGGQAVPQLARVAVVIGDTRVEGRVTRLGKLEDLRFSPFDTAYGGLLVRREGRSLAARDPKSGAVQWRFYDPDGGRSDVFASDETGLYVATALAPDYSLPYDKVVWRLDMKTGRPSATFALPPLPKPWVSQTVTAVLPGPRGVAVLADLTSLSPDDDRRGFRACRLAFYTAHASRLVWQAVWPSKGGSHWRGSCLGDALEDPAEPQWKMLTWVGDKLLVCPSDVGPLRLVRVQDGQEESELARLWEFRRGFVGPSVYSYFVARNGFAGWEPRDSAGDEPDKTLEGRVLAGPVAAKGKPSRWCDGDLIYVAAERARTEEDSVPVGDAYMYEIRLSRKGKLEPVSVTPLPRQPTGPCWVDGDSVTWACEYYGLVRSSPSECVEAAPWMNGTDAVLDHVGRVEWYREAPPVKPNAWLRCGNAVHVAAFFGNLAIGDAGPPYLLKKRDRIVRVPMAITELRTGLRKPFELLLVLDRPASIPDAAGLDYDGAMATSYPYPFRIGLTKVAGDRLLVGLSKDEVVYQAEFDLRRILRAAGFSQNCAGIGRPASDNL